MSRLPSRAAWPTSCRKSRKVSVNHGGSATGPAAAADAGPGRRKRQKSRAGSFTVARRSRSAAEHEIHRTHDTQRRPEVVELERLVHVEQRERDEHEERDRFLDDLQLREAELAEADAIRGNLEQVLEQRHAPRRERRDEPGLGGELLQMRVPSEGHEYIREREQSDGLCKDGGVHRLPNLLYSLI